MTTKKETLWKTYYHREGIFHGHVYTDKRYKKGDTIKTIFGVGVVTVCRKVQSCDPEVWPGNA